MKQDWCKYIIIHLPVNKILEHNDMVAEVKGLPVVQQAGIHRGALVDEVVDCLYDCPGAHVGRTFCLVSKLVIIILQF